MNAAPVVIADAAERALALDPQRSFIVQAPAGSGKTELLVRRFARLLATVERPEEVLAITFTRKAAAEMKKRVLLALDNSAGTAQDIAPDFAPNRAPNLALEIAPRLRIMTIDSLCASLTRQMPVLAQFGAQPGIVEGEEARALYRDAAVRTLARLEGDGEAADHVARLLTHLDNNLADATQLLASMLARRDQWLRRAGNPPTREELEAAFASERARLISAAQVLHPGACEELARAMLTKAGDWRKRPPAPPEMIGNEPLRLALVALLNMPPATYKPAQWEVLASILALLKLAAAELKLVFAERGQADFTEFAQGAVRALGSSEDPSELLLRMDAGLRHVLVDEFQDTSISQWELLERLTAGWVTGDGRTVFAVGDPMQSIYRFREAEVALFLHARHAGLGEVQLESLTLTTNFRSQAGIVDWVNDTFSRVLPQTEDEVLGAVPYAPAVPHPHNVRLAGDAVRWHAFDDRQDEARRVIEILGQARADNPGGTCAILVRNRNTLTDIVPALDRAGIRYRAVEIEKLGEKQVVQDLYALVRALAHPADRIAWLALLRARWCGLPMADLGVIADGGVDAQAAGAGIFRQSSPCIWEAMHDPERLVRLSDDGRARLARVRAVLEPVQSEALRYSLRERVEGAWMALGGPACVDAPTELEDADIFLDQLDKLEDAGDIADLAALQASIDELFALPDLDALDTDLQLMTIHKAKGLEFDTVIVPGLDRAPRAGERPLLAWKVQANAQLLLAPVNEAGDDKEAMFKYVREQSRLAEDTEAGRLLYVAVTRARSRLHLLGCVKRDQDDVVRPPSKRSLLAKLWPVMGDAFAQAAEMSASEIANVAGVAGNADIAMPLHADGAGNIAATPSALFLRRLPPDWCAPAVPSAVAWAVLAARTRAGDAVEFSWVGETARHIGSVVHRWLQHIAEDEMKGWNAARIKRLQATFRNALAARGVDDAALAAAAERVAAALVNALADARGQWLLGPQQDARNEYRLTAIMAGERYNLVVDRTFVDAEGRRWIVDYKTGGHAGADLDGFLDGERERYRTQLERYAITLAGRDAAALGLYFPLLAGWREWSSRGDGDIG